MKNTPRYFLLFLFPLLSLLAFSGAHAAILSVSYEKTEFFGGNDERAYALAVESGANPNVYVAGYANFGSGNVAPRIIKYDSTGALVRTGIVPNGLTPEAVAINPANNLIYSVSGSRNGQGIIVEYDSTLNLVAQTLSAPIDPNDPAYFCDDFSDLAGVAADETGVYVVGSYGRRLREGAGCAPGYDYNFWLAKYDLGLTARIGAYQFYNRASGNPGDTALDVAVDGDHNAYVAGASTMGGYDDWVVVRFNASGGQPSLVEAFDDSGDVDRATDIVIDLATGNVNAAGYTCWLGCDRRRIAQYNSSTLALLWSAATSSLPDQSQTTGLAVDKFRNIYVSGGDLPVGSNPSFIEKYDSSGKFIWRYTTQSTVFFSDVGMNNDEIKIYAAGWAGSPNRYRTVAISQRCNGTSSLPNYTIPWTDDPIVPNVTKIRATHVNELRTWIDDRRRDAGAGLGNYPWAEAIIPNQTKIKATHFNEMRTALTDAFSACANTIDFGGVQPGVTVRSADVDVLRAFTKSHPERP